MDEIAQALLHTAKELLKTGTANSILLYAKSQEQIPIIKEFSNLIVATSDRNIFNKIKDEVDNALFIAPRDLSQIGQLKHAVLFAVLAGLLSKGDKVVCISSTGKTKQIDFIAVFDTEEETQTLASYDIAKLIERVPIEVVESVIHIAIELTEEGREGQPVGTIFVIGDTDEVEKYTRQLIFNPFRGYPEEDRNIMDFSIKETVKEFAQIDGAFIVKSDGTIVSAGTYIDAPLDGVSIPQGLGSRHLAACAITTKTKAVSVVVSQSGAIRMFKDGKIILGIEGK